MFTKNMNFRLCLLTWLMFIFCVGAFGQETEREPFAIEFPELNTGQLSTVKAYVSSSSDLNVVKFWIFDPVAESIDWNRVFVQINRQAAIRICSQMASGQGKILRCDLNHFFGFKLQPKENLFEIEAQSRDGKRYFATFTVFTDPVAANKQGGSAGSKTALGFSGRKFAVVMGVSRYHYNDVGLGNLSYADADADAINNWLTQKGGFNPQDILLLTNENATLAGVRDSLGRFLAKATETDLVLFFFAGHGTPDPFNPNELYYLLYDSKVADLRNTGLPMVELKRIIDTQLKSKRAIFLLDTCHSAGLSGKTVVSQRTEKAGSGNRDLGNTGIKERQLVRVDVTNTVSSAASQLFGQPGRAVLTSSDTDETSREGTLWGGGHGVFTWALLEGLNGKADANGNRVITADELFNFVRERVRAETNSKQNPHLFSNLANGLEIVVLK